MKTSNMNGVVILQACTSSCEQLDRKCCRRPAILDRLRRHSLCLHHKCLSILPLYLCSFVIFSPCFAMASCQTAGEHQKYMKYMKNRTLTNIESWKNRVTETGCDMLWQHFEATAFKFCSSSLQNRLRACHQIVRVAVVNLQEQWHLSNIDIASARKHSNKSSRPHVSLSIVLSHFLVLSPSLYNIKESWAMREVIIQL